MRMISDIIMIELFILAQIGLVLSLWLFGKELWGYLKVRYWSEK